MESQRRRTRANLTLVPGASNPKGSHSPHEARDTGSHSGADPGVGSIGAISGRPRGNQRDVRAQPEMATGRPSSENQSTDPMTSSGLTQRITPAVPTTGSRGIRKKWTKEINIDVMRAYFIATEANKIGYLQKMHEVWKTIRPDLSNITQQRLGDQKRVIHRNNLLVRWLRDGHLFGETEGFMITIQDHVIWTKNHQKFIEKLPLENDLCKVCNRYSETIEHITTRCPNLANTEYLHRHNLTAAIVHQQIAKYYNLITEIVPYYEYKPKTVLENSDMKLYWDREIITDQTINCNRPDIVFINQNNKTAFFIDITHPADHNITKAESEKIAKYNDLTTEFKDMYKLKSVETIPIAISGTGLITKNLPKFLSKLELPSDRICLLMQKSVILETYRITRKVLNIKE